MFEQFNKKPNRRNTNCIKWDYQAAGGQLPFGVADSDYSTAPCIIKAIQKRASCGCFGYTRLGPEFFQAVKGWYKKSHNVEIDVNWIVPTTGVLRAIKIALNIISKPGDTVIIQTPVYSSFYHLLGDLNRPVVENKLINKDEKYTMDYADLEEKFKQGNKILLLCSPHNPISRVWTKEELEKVADLSKKYGVTVISDEIHSDLILGDSRFVSMLEFKDIYQNLFVTSAPTKTFNMAGLLSSYLICPDEVKKNRCQEYTFNNQMAGINILSASATVSAYSDDEAFAWMKEQNQFLRGNFEFVKEYLHKHLPKATFPDLQGTYLMWINLSYLGLSSEQLYKSLYQAGISINGGADYGKEYEGYIRFNIACPLNQVKKGIKILCYTFKKNK